MPKLRTARERARSELTREIKDEARRQLATHGAEALSLRAVARELGVVSSALYRYFPSRDDLLTALIIDAYDAIGQQVEDADARRRRGDFLGRWRACCHAVRDWGLAHPREYALIYGSPIVGYQAPRDTVDSAARVPRALLAVVRDCAEAGALEPPSGLPRAAARQVDQLVTTVEDLRLRGVPPAALGAVLTAWTQLYGMVSFELFGHLEGLFDDKRALFEHSTGQLAQLIGLRPRSRRG
ncbi:TetR/AcrR family transcriptional regulator [Actinopolymorpha sp. B11F2]|uniref:TetR/AcrR family transcriptional regulator n=1 Tax=Actinopolymorpha sp. B11F2 TaxID=3160862 RepID=UPI0032E3E378